MTTAPTRDDLLDELGSILAGRLGLGDLGPIDARTRFFADLGLASIDAVVLGEALQAQYGRSLPFGDLMSELGRRADRDLTLGELADFLGRHLSGSR